MNAPRSRLRLLPLLLALAAACGPGLPGEEHETQTEPPPAPPPVTAAPAVIEGLLPGVLSVRPASSARPASVYVQLRGATSGTRLTLNGQLAEGVFVTTDGLWYLRVPAAMLQQAGTLKIGVYGAPESAARPLEVLTGPALHSVFRPYRTLSDSRWVSVEGDGFDADTVLHWDGIPLPTRLVLRDEGFPPDLEAEVSEPLWSVHAGPLVAVSPRGTSNPLALSVGEQEPVPVASRLQPARLAVGGLERSLLVMGEGFGPGATVRIDGVQRTLRPTQGPGLLQVLLTDADLGAPHTSRVTVHASDGSSSLPLLLHVGAEREAPVVERLEPAAAPVGTGSLVLRVRGSGFHGMSQVLWNGVVLPTRSLEELPGSDTYALEVTLSSAQLASAGTAEVAVFTAGPGGGTSEALPFLVRPAGAGEEIRLSRASVEKGAGELELTVEGTGFDSDTRVRVQGVDLTPSSVTAAQLQVRLPASTFSTPGRVQVRVARPGTSPSEPSLLHVRAQPRPPQLMSVSPGVVSLGDVTGDVSFSFNAFVRNLTPERLPQPGPDPLAPVLKLGGASAVLGIYSGPWADLTFASSAYLPGSLLAREGEVEVRVSREPEGGSSSFPLRVLVTAAKHTAFVTALIAGRPRVGAPSALVQLYGQGLGEASVVNLDGHPLPTRHQGSSLLATVPAELLTEARIAQLTVSTPAPWATQSQPSPLVIEAAAP